MASAHKSRSVMRSPEFQLYKTVTEAPESGPFATLEHGVATRNYDEVVIDVAPDAAANPTIIVLFWSPQKELFVVNDPALTVAGKGAGVGYQFIVRPCGRIMFVQVSAGVAGGQQTDISVAGCDLEHP